MVRPAIARASYAALTVPHFLLILAIKVIRYRSVLDDYMKCINHIQDAQFLDQRRTHVSDALLRALVLAEDHRNDLHYGVDHYGIARSVKVRIFHQQRQGASTIEQQFVRTVTGRYEKTPRRKIREQVLAIMINFHFPKDTISKCYLNCAYYGWDLEGYDGWNSICREKSSLAAQRTVAFLKYPKTKHPNPMQSLNHELRVAHISRLIAKSFDTDFS